MKWLLAYLSSFLLLAGTASANLLLNPSFESGSGVDADDWTEFGNVGREEWADKNGTALADSGVDAPADFGMALQGWLDSGNGGFYQDVAGTPGLVYELSADFHFEPNFDPGTMELKLEWMDAGVSPISATVLNVIPLIVPGSSPATGSEWQNLSISGTAPVGTASVRSTVFFSGTSDLGGLQASRVDNANLVVVPEPASIALFLTGLGLMGILRRRFA